LGEFIAAPPPFALGFDAPSSCELCKPQPLVFLASQKDFSLGSLGALSGILTFSIPLSDSTCLGLYDFTFAVRVVSLLVLISTFVTPFSCTLVSTDFCMNRAMSSPPPHAYWASADDWQPGFVMLGIHVDAIPTPPPPSPAIVGVDGLWGAHEWTVYPQPHHPRFPYLAWIPLRKSSTSVFSHVLHSAVDKTMWQTHSDNPNIRVIKPTLLDALKREWVSTKAALLDPFETVRSHPSFSSVQHPHEAYVRGFGALCRLEKDFEAWRDFVEVFRNLQRCLLELHAFLDWWRDIRAGDISRLSIRAPTRGAIFEDAQLYEQNARWSVGAFLLVRKSIFVLDPAKQVALSPRTCKAPMSLGPLLHSLPIWYYPPLVEDIKNLELAARGYLGRLDTYNPTTATKRKRDKTENRNNDEGKLFLCFP
jgi:hypothetical protein